MSFIGKFITLFIFLMSLLFLAFAVMVKSNHVNWREIAVDELAPKLTKVNDEVDALNREQIRLRDAIEHEQAALRGALIALEVRAIQTQELLAQKAQDYQALQSTRLQRIQELTAIELELKQLLADITKLDDEIQTTKLASGKEFERAVEIQSRIHEAVGLHRRLSERYDQLRVQIELINDGSAAAAPASASVDPPGTVR
jgi:chromosome segregation ATPase